LSGGLALEGINNALNLKSNLILILNDNEMSISKPVGAISDYLTKVRTSNLYAGTKERIEAIISKIPKIGVPLVNSVEQLKNRVKHFFVDFKFGVVFEELGFKYFGPIDGHNIPVLMSTLDYAKDAKGPVLIHILTKKGKGYKPAEGEPTKFHGISPFHRENGDSKLDKGLTFTSVFGKTACEIAKTHEKIVCITAAMRDGTGLGEFSEKYPKGFYDVGIAEEHAVSFASGFASQGFKPIVAIYSTFMQRAYDQIVHDVCLNNLPVIFAIDRAGIVGEDGATHTGAFDMAYLRTVPNLTFMAPANGEELKIMLEFAVKINSPVAIRYPKGRTNSEVEVERIHLGKGVTLFDSKIENNKAKVLVVSIGSMVYPAVEAAKELEKEKIQVQVINARFIKPLDKELIVNSCKSVDLVVTVEEGALHGGFGSAILELMDEGEISVPIARIGIPDNFVPHGKREQLLEKYGLDKDGIVNLIKERICK